MLKKNQPRELPVYKIDADEESIQGIRFISLVENPAIEVKGMCFSLQGTNETEHQFKVSKDRQIIAGPAMIPNMKILRIDEETGQEYYVVFTPEAISKLADKFNSNNNNRSINLEHSKEMVDGFIQACWIVEDSTYDKSKYYGFNLPVGAFFIEVKINDTKFWNNVVKGEGRNGFSIEGIFKEILSNFDKMVREELSIDEVIDSFTIEELYEVFNMRPPVHDNCKCFIENKEWIVAEGCCDYCQEQADNYNN